MAKSKKASEAVIDTFENEESIVEIQPDVQLEESGEQSKDKKLKNLQNQVMKIKYLIESTPYESENKPLNRMLKVRYDEIDRIKQYTKVTKEIQALEKKLLDLKKQEEKLK